MLIHIIYLYTYFLNVHLQLFKLFIYLGQALSCNFSLLSNSRVHETNVRLILATCTRIHLKTNFTVESVLFVCQERNDIVRATKK
jgi:hypothetical protein